MPDELKQAFDAYLDLAREKLTPPNAGPNHPLELLRNKTHLLELVENLENKPEFTTLLENTRRAYGIEEGSFAKSRLKNAVQNFLRRSRCYLNFFDGNGSEPLFEKYTESFQQKEAQHYYFALMEGVEFSEDTLDFDKFKIQKFSQSEWDNKLDLDVLKIFYPFISPSQEDYQLFQYFWFIHTSKKKSLEPFTSIIKFPGPEVTFESTHHSKELSPILQILALYPWKDIFLSDQDLNSDRWFSWNRFTIPIEMELSDSLLKPPLITRGFSRIDSIPLFDTSTGEEVEGSAIPQQPHTIFDINETKTFQSFIKRIQGVMDKSVFSSLAGSSLAKSTGRSREFLLKGFFEENNIEELLWHFASIEALLGEKKEGLTNTLKKRISNILGDNPENRKIISKKFDELYNFRSELIHGRNFEGKMDRKHLREARELAQKTCIWFLSLIDLMGSEFDEGGSFPTREEILKTIDLGPDALSKIQNFITKLPPGYPFLPLDSFSLPETDL